MIKVVLGANVFVSALLAAGSNAATILDLVRTRKIELLVSDGILSEVARVLQYPKIKKRHGLTDEELAEFLEDCIRFATVTQEALMVEIIKEDPADDKYLACAVEGDADFIVSGDHHLTGLGMFRTVQIVNPAEFLRIIREDGNG
ncbi:MAG: putative toxin-antitoxin system toxin component, PIN family [Desulfobacterales bacterium]